MKKARSRKGDGRGEGQKLAHLVDQAIDEGADTVEKITARSRTFPTPREIALRKAAPRTAATRAYAR